MVEVSVHVAQSLDGRLAVRGVATPLSTPEGKRSAHIARAQHDAVLVGIETIRIDDPLLTVRHVEGSNPLRVVLASALDVPKTARVLRAADRAGPKKGENQLQQPLLVIGARGRATDAARDALRGAGADVVIVDATSDGMVSLSKALDVLAERGVKKLLVEGGGRVLTSFFRERLVHRVEIEIAMVVLGEPGTATLGSLGVEGLAQAPRLTNITVERLGTSVFVRGDVVAAGVAAVAARPLFVARRHEEDKKRPTNE